MQYKNEPEKEKFMLWFFQIFVVRGVQSVYVKNWYTSKPGHMHLANKQ